MTYRLLLETAQMAGTVVRVQSILAVVTSSMWCRSLSVRTAAVPAVTCCHQGAHLSPGKQQGAAKNACGYMDSRPNKVWISCPVYRQLDSTCPPSYWQLVGQRQHRAEASSIVHLKAITSRAPYHVLHHTSVNIYVNFSFKLYTGL